MSKYLVDSSGKLIGKTDLTSGFKDGTTLVATPPPTPQHYYDKVSNSWVSTNTAAIIDITTGTFSYSGNTLILGSNSYQTVLLEDYSKIEVVNSVVVSYLPDGSVAPTTNYEVVNKALYDILKQQTSVVIENNTSGESMLTDRTYTNAVRKLEKLVTQYIQKQVDMYNKAHGVSFGSIHNMAIYTLDPTYTHYNFAVAIIAWNIQLWETVRAYQETAVDIPTELEFQAVLDSVPITW